MNMVFETVLQAALALPHDQRADIAYRLIRSLDGPEPTPAEQTEIDAAWAEGAALEIDEAVAYAARGRGERGRPSSGWASLTPAELDVVRLVAEGLTNPQVGERLFISRRTVQTHLAHIFAKLGISTRHELTKLAGQRGP